MKHSLRLTDVTRYASVSLKPRSNYVCHQCRQIAFVSARRARTPPPVYIHRRFASGDNSWTDNLRRRLWGTDNPPGQEDPYSQPTIRDEEKMHERAAAEAEEATNRKASIGKVVKGEYQKSLTWDDLDQIGGQDESWKEAWDENHPFEGFVPMENRLVKSAESQFYSFMAPAKMESREEISEAIHRALVEVFTLKEARVRMEICMGYGETSEAHYFKDVSFEQAANGTTVPIFAYEQLREEVLDSLTEVENESATDIGASADESRAPVREETELIEDDQAFQVETDETVMLEERSNDETWLNVSFHDSKTKFAVSRRFHVQFSLLTLQRL